VKEAEAEIVQLIQASARADWRSDAWLLGATVYQSAGAQAHNWGRDGLTAAGRRPGAATATARVEPDIARSGPSGVRIDSAVHDAEVPTDEARVTRIASALHLDCLSGAPARDLVDLRPLAPTTMVSRSPSPIGFS
jgi:hypothetical protein